MFEFEEAGHISFLVHNQRCREPNASRMSGTNHADFQNGFKKSGVFVNYRDFRKSGHQFLHLALHRR
jgi:hypothetical protein